MSVLPLLGLGVAVAWAVGKRPKKKPPRVGAHIESYRGHQIQVRQVRGPDGRLVYVYSLDGGVFKGHEWGLITESHAILNARGEIDEMFEGVNEP
jgi:hypothetical protein